MFTGKSFDRRTTMGRILMLALAFLSLASSSFGREREVIHGDLGRSHRSLQVVREAWRRTSSHRHVRPLRIHPETRDDDDTVSDFPPRVKNGLVEFHRDFATAANGKKLHASFTWWKTNGRDASFPFDGTTKRTPFWSDRLGSWSDGLHTLNVALLLLDCRFLLF